MEVVGSNPARVACENLFHRHLESTEYAHVGVGQNYNPFSGY